MTILRAIYITPDNGSINLVYPIFSIVDPERRADIIEDAMLGKNSYIRGYIRDSSKVKGREYRG